MRGPVWFSEADVTRLLSPAALIERLEAAFRDADAGLLTEPRPLRIDACEHGANYVAFPAYWPAAGLATTKVLSGVLGNPERGLPKIDAVIIVMDAVTGAIRAIMDGRRITALRTAATTALACRALGMKQNGVLALIGTGVQLLAHAETMTAIADCETIIIASAADNLERAQRSADAVSNLLGRPAIAMSRRVALAEADTIVLSTISDQPVLRLGDTGPDAVIASVGPFHPGGTELDPAVVRKASAVMSDMPSRLCDQWAAEREALGDNYDRLFDLQAIIAGSLTVQMDGLRIFLSDGRSIEDLAAASLVLEAAAAAGVEGTPLP
jgi:ornithine cyclodeaminase/alanine dehydrogenase-like protein (mu-crystallin family)